MEKLVTERLTLRPLTLDDAADMYAIYGDARAMRFMPNAAHESVQQTHNHIQYNLSHGDAHWAILLTGSETVIGKVHYLGGTRFPGMGYILHPDYWGQGITTEACRAALDYGFAHLGYDRVELWIDETNGASMRVAQKLGFAPKGRIPSKYQHQDHYHYWVVWGVRKHQWQQTEAPTDASVPFYSMEPVLKVRDIVETTDYYRDKLGFHVDFHYGDPPNHAGVSRGEWSGNVVSIQLSQVLPEREITPASHLHIRIGIGIDRLHDAYAANGVEIVEAPADKPWGFREFAIRDLNGYVLIFAQYL